MRITNAFNQNFTKDIVAACKLNNWRSDTKSEAILWKYNANDEEDRREITFSEKLPQSVKDNFNSIYYRNNPSANLYILENISEYQEGMNILGYCLTQNHYMQLDSMPEKHTVVFEEFRTDLDYPDAIDPFLAQVATYFNNSASNIFVPTGQDELAPSASIEFKQSEQGEYYIPSENYLATIKQAQKSCEFETFI